MQLPFVDYGLDSVQAVSIVGDLETWLGRSLSPTLIWDFPTIEDLAKHLAGDEQPQPSWRNCRCIESEPIAVIGLGCRFPGAEGPDAFWQLLQGAEMPLLKCRPHAGMGCLLCNGGPEPTRAR